MLSFDEKLTSRSGHERLLRARAVEEARTLFAVHGAAALDLIRMTRFEAERDAQDRRCLRLTRIELERLERNERAKQSTTAFQPPPGMLSALLVILGETPKPRATTASMRGPMSGRQTDGRPDRPEVGTPAPL